MWRFYKGEQLTYVFTIGVLFLLYSFVELVGGNGAIAVLMLSLCLGNLPLILGTILGGRVPLLSGFSKAYKGGLKGLTGRFDDVLHKIRESQVDFAFFIRNFFFVYLGIIFDPERMNLVLVGISLAILTLMFVSRYMSARILALSEPKFKQYATIITGMVARGFTATFAAILVSIVYERRAKPG